MMRQAVANTGFTDQAMFWVVNMENCVWPMPVSLIF